MIRRRLHVSLVAAALACVACGSDGDSPNDADAAVDDELKQILRGTDYTLEPGEERYICYTFRSPSDRTVAISEITGRSGVGEHHIALFQTEPEEQDGVFDCPTLVALNWQPIWAGGTGSPNLELPDNVAFKIRPDTQYLIQVHLQNASDQPITSNTEVELTYLPADEAEAADAAGIYAVGTFEIEIPALTSDFSLTTECVTDRPLNVFAAFPHMHKIGSKIEFFHGADAASAQSIYKLDPWPFDDQPMDPVDWRIEQGDYTRATCTWDNPFDKPIVFGDSSDDEMCFFVMFYYPSDGLAGCVEGF